MFPRFCPFLSQFLSPGQSIPCCAMQQHSLRGNASLNQPNRLDCGGARLSGNRGAARVAAFSSRCSSIFLMTTGSSMQAMTLALPPQIRHLSTSRLNTRLSLWAQVIAMDGMYAGFAGAKTGHRRRRGDNTQNHGHLPGSSPESDEMPRSGDRCSAERKGDKAALRCALVSKKCPTRLVGDREGILLFTTTLIPGRV